MSGKFVEVRLVNTATRIAINRDAIVAVSSFSYLGRPHARLHLSDGRTYDAVMGFEEATELLNASEDVRRSRATVPNQRFA